MLSKPVKNSFLHLSPGVRRIEYFASKKEGRKKTMLCAKKIKEMLQAKKEGEKTKQCCMPKKDKTNVASKNSKMLRAKAGKSHPILGA